MANNILTVCSVLIYTVDAGQINREIGRQQCYLYIVGKKRDMCLLHAGGYLPRVQAQSECKKRTSPEWQGVCCLHTSQAAPCQGHKGWGWGTNTAPCQGGLGLPLFACMPSAYAHLIVPMRRCMHN